MNEFVKWYEIVPGICGYLYDVVEEHQQQKALVALQIGNDITYHKFKVYVNAKGIQYINTILGRIPIYKFHRNID